MLYQDEEDDISDDRSDNSSDNLTSNSDNNSFFDPPLENYQFFYKNEKTGVNDSSNSSSAAAIIAMKSGESQNYGLMMKQRKYKASEFDNGDDEDSRASGYNKSHSHNNQS